MKKRRRRGSETIAFLHEEALREEGLAIQWKQQEVEEKNLASYLDQQKSIMEVMHDQQQQQSQISMAVVDKPKKLDPCTQQYFPLFTTLCHNLMCYSFFLRINPLCC